MAEELVKPYEETIQHVTGERLDPSTTQRSASDTTAKDPGSRRQGLDTTLSCEEDLEETYTEF